MVNKNDTESVLLPKNLFFSDPRKKAQYICSPHTRECYQSSQENTHVYFPFYEGDILNWVKIFL